MYGYRLAAESVATKLFFSRNGRITGALPPRLPHRTFPSSFHCQTTILLRLASFKASRDPAVTRPVSIYLAEC